MLMTFRKRVTDRGIQLFSDDGVCRTTTPTPGLPISTLQENYFNILLFECLVWMKRSFAMCPIIHKNVSQFNLQVVMSVFCLSSAVVPL